jgi:hypothetical protein
MSTRNLTEGKALLTSKPDSLTAIYELIVWKMWKPRRLTILWASKVSYRNNLTFYILLKFVYFPFFNPHFLSFSVQFSVYPFYKSIPQQWHTFAYCSIEL